jgi:amino acid transporter
MSSFVRPDLAGSQPLRDTAHDPKRSWRTWLFGRPLSTADAEDEAIGKAVGLAVFASDALSSTAYATQEILAILAVAGAAAFVYAQPISVAIVILLALVTLSYEQTIHAYPGGGGAYIVSRDNLGELPAQIAAAALLTDYILTVAVSVSSGVAQIASAFPFFLEHRVGLAVTFVVLIMVVNLRGVRESGAVFAVPSYFFIGMAFLTVGVGLVRYLTGGLETVPGPPPLHSEGAAVTLFLLLHAF